MSRSANAPSSSADASGDGGIGRPKSHDERDLGAVAQPALDQLVVQQQRRLARRRRALERRRDHPDDHPAAVEVRQRVAQRERAGDGVELVAGFDQARGRRRIEIGAQRDHEDVRVERPGVGLDPLGVRIDRPDAGLDERARRA